MKPGWMGRRRAVVRSMGALCACVLIVGSLEAEEAPDAGTLLFERPQLARTRPGDVLDYAYQRTISDSAAAGSSLDDHIRLEIGKGAESETRSVEVQMFSGANRRPAGPFPDMSGNPILSLILEDSVQSLSSRLGANPRYLKNVIRAAFRDAAQITPDLVGDPGHTSPGWQIVITPFSNDSNRARMGGLQNLTYTFRVGEAIPGEIYQIEITAPDQSGKVLFQEKVHYVQTSP